MKKHSKISLPFSLSLLSLALFFLWICFYHFYLFHLSTGSFSLTHSNTLSLSLLFYVLIYFLCIYYSDGWRASSRERERVGEGEGEQMDDKLRTIAFLDSLLIRGTQLICSSLLRWYLTSRCTKTNLLLSQELAIQKPVPVHAKIITS